MIKVNFYEIDSIDDKKLLFAVIVTRYNGQWLYVKHKDRQTWEIPGGHREENESIHNTASLELFEETGACKFNIEPVCIYSVESDNTSNYTESHGELFYSEVEQLDNLSNFEISEIGLFDNIPDDLTYPLIQPFLYRKVLNFLKDKTMD